MKVSRKENADVKTGAKNGMSLTVQCEQNALAEVPAHSAPSYTPAYLTAENPKQGLGDLSLSDVTISRIRLMQSLTPEVIAREYTPGDLVDSVTKKNYGNKISCTILMLRRSAIDWVPRKEGGGMRRYSIDGKIWDTGQEVSDLDFKFNKDGTRPNAVKYFNWLVLPMNEKFPVNISFPLTTKENRASGQAPLNWAFRNGLPIFAKPWELATRQVTNAKGTYFVCDFRPLEGWTNEERVGLAKKIIADLELLEKAKKISIDLGEEEGEQELDEGISAQTAQEY